MGWTHAKIAGIETWTQGLVTITLDTPMDFEAGQFVTLAKMEDGKRIKRQYSVGSAPGAPLEFFIVQVDDGALTPDLLARPVGAEVMLLDKAAGFFTLKWVPDAPAIWLMSTGTGLAPYIAMLRQGDIFERFEHIVVVHGVRHAVDLAYAKELAELSAVHPGLRYVAAVTRDETADGPLHGRITNLLTDGELEKAADLKITPDHQVMMCGNPAMLDQMQSLLEDRGLAVNKRKAPGQITVERYW